MAASSPVVLSSNHSTIAVLQASQPLPTGASTETTLASRLTEATYTTRMPTLGQKASAASTPIVIASDQSTVPVSQASQPLPMGAATETTVASINTKTPTQGQTTMAASSPVVIASNQSTVPVSQASQPLPTGASTEATLLTMLTEAMFTSRIPTLGQKSVAGCIPVVLPTGQTIVSVSITQGSEKPTFIVATGPQGVAFNKSMLSMFNDVASLVVVKVQALYLVNTLNTTASGDLALFQVRRCTGCSSGTLLTPQTFDTVDTFDSSVMCRMGATIAGEGSIFWDNTWSGDEWAVGKSGPENFDHAIQAKFPMWAVNLGSKPFTLRAGEGMTVKYATNGNVGSWDVKILFTTE
jgi:hypothetical protein